MKNIKIVILLLLAFISPKLMFAQNGADDNYIEAVDYVTCICINDALPIKETRIDCGNSLIQKKDIKESKTVLLFEELQSLKKAKKQDYIKFLSEDIFNDNVKYKKIYEFAKNRKATTLNNLKTDIKNYLDANNYVSDVSPQSEEIIQDTTGLEANDVQPVTVIAQSSSTRGSSFFAYNFWTIFFGVLIVLIIIFVIIITKKLSDLKNNIKNKKRESVQPPLPISQNPNLSEINKINHEIKEIKNALKDITVSKVHSTATVVPAKENSVITESKAPEKIRQEIFYMATPNDDRSFDISGRSDDFRATQSLYKFTLDSRDNNRAAFVFFSDEAGIRDAVNYPQTYIDPVCDPQNALNQNAKQIITTQPGTAEKRNNKWVVVDKAKIKYQ